MDIRQLSLPATLCLATALLMAGCAGMPVGNRGSGGTPGPGQTATSQDGAVGGTGTGSGAGHGTKGSGSAGGHPQR